MTTNPPHDVLAQVRDAYLRTEATLERVLAALDNPVEHVKPEALEQGVEQALDDLTTLASRMSTRYDELVDAVIDERLEAFPSLAAALRSSAQHVARLRRRVEAKRSGADFVGDALEQAADHFDELREQQVEQYGKVLRDALPVIESQIASHVDDDDVAHVYAVEIGTPDQVAADIETRHVLPVAIAEVGQYDRPGAAFEDDELARRLAAHDATLVVITHRAALDDGTLTRATAIAHPFGVTVYARTDDGTVEHYHVSGAWAEHAEGVDLEHLDEIAAHMSHLLEAALIERHTS